MMACVHAGPSPLGPRDRTDPAVAQEDGTMLRQALTTTVVGSYPQPDWLIDRTMLSKGVPRVRARAMWRVPEPYLEQAQDDATVVAIREMERAGIDVVTDGE